MVRALVPRVLKDEPQFRLLLGSQVLSVLGDRVASLALPFAVLASGGELREVALVSAAQFVPFVVLALPAGVWADKFDRKRILIASDFVRFASQGAAATLLISGVAEPWHLIVSSAIYGTADAFFAPAFSGLLPSTVSQDNLQPANALRGLSYSAGNVLGPALAGLVIAMYGPGVALGLDAATFALSIVLLFLLGVGRTGQVSASSGAPEPDPQLGTGSANPAARTTLTSDHVRDARSTGCREVAGEEGSGGRESFLPSLRMGWSEVRSRPWVLAFLGAMSTYHLVVLPSVFVLGPVLMERDYAGAQSWALITTCFGVGCLAGDLIFLRWQPLNAMSIASLALLMASCQAGLIGSGLPPWLIGISIGCCGVGVTGAYTLWTTSLGEHVPNKALSRVSSYDYLVTSGAIPAGNVLAGVAGEQIGLRPTLLAMTTVGVTVCAGVALVGSVRTLPRASSADRG